MASDPEKPRCCRGTMVTLWLCIFAAIAGGGAWAWANYVQTYHFAAVQDGVLYRDGNRGIREFETALRKSGAKTVVSLIDDQELADAKKPQFSEEADLCRKQGVQLVRIPVKLGGWPKSEDVQKFLDVAQKQDNQPVLVHCAQGVRRTGMMVAAFEESMLGWDQSRAKAAIQTFGHSERTAKDVERFIGVYDPKARIVTAQLEQSKED